MDLQKLTPSTTMGGMYNAFNNNVDVIGRIDIPDFVIDSAETFSAWWNSSSTYSTVVVRGEVTVPSISTNLMSTTKVLVGEPGAKLIVEGRFYGILGSNLEKVRNLYIKVQSGHGGSIFNGVDVEDVSLEFRVSGLSGTVTIFKSCVCRDVHVLVGQWIDIVAFDSCNDLVNCDLTVDSYIPSGEAPLYVSYCGFIRCVRLVDCKVIILDYSDSGIYSSSIYVYGYRDCEDLCNCVFECSKVEDNGSDIIGFRESNRLINCVCLVDSSYALDLIAYERCTCIENSLGKFKNLTMGYGKYNYNFCSCLTLCTAATENVTPGEGRMFNSCSGVLLCRGYYENGVVSFSSGSYSLVGVTSETYAIGNTPNGGFNYYGSGIV